MRNALRVQRKSSRHFVALQRSAHFELMIVGLRARYTQRFDDRRIDSADLDALAHAVRACRRDQVRRVIRIRCAKRKEQTAIVEKARHVVSQRDAADVPHHGRGPCRSPARELTAAEIEALLEARVVRRIDKLDAQRTRLRRCEPLRVGFQHAQHVDVVQHAQAHALVQRDRRRVIGLHFEMPVTTARSAKLRRNVRHHFLADAAATPRAVDDDLPHVAACAERNGQRVRDELAALRLEEERVRAIVRVPPVELERRLVGIELTLEPHPFGMVLATCGTRSQHGPSVMPAPVGTSTNMQSSFGPGVTLIDFTAKWCGPCKQMEPVMATLAKEYAGRVKVVAVDVDDEQLIAQQYNVRSMPTFVLVRDGKEVGRVVGTRPRGFIAGMLDRALAGDSAIANP